MSPALIRMTNRTRAVRYNYTYQRWDKQINGRFSTENIKLVFVILEIHFFKKDSVRFFRCLKNYFRR